jgi:1-aminocyclopropane-1-carboxylate deaminase/D-cysteine desulfhydrase-like pyridoxal-dependent ACC family enzyme
VNVLIGARDGKDFMIILGSRNYAALGGYTLLSTEFVAQSDSADVFVGVFQGADGSATTIAVDDVSVTLQRVCP